MGNWKQKGGGFIGVVKAVTFESKEWESENAKDGEYTTITAKLMVLKDGADEPIEQYLPAGFLYEGQSISKNGKTLVDANSDESPIIDGGSDFARLVDTYEEAGGDPKPFEANYYRNFDALVGVRAQFKNEINKERQIAAGLKKLKAKRGTKANEDGTYTIGAKKYTEAEVMEAGKRQDKNDKTKFYNQTRLVITTILGAAASKAAAAEEDDDDDDEPVVKKAKKPAVEEDDEDEVVAAGPSDKEAEKFFKSLLKEEEGEISRSDIPVLVARKVKNKAERDVLVKKLSAVDFLQRENGWSLFGPEKKMVISLD